MNIKLQLTSWQKDSQTLSYIRRRVFIDEQKVPEELEWDTHDADSIHVLATYNNSPVATGRMKKNGHIG